MKFSIPGEGPFDIEAIILGHNGTVSFRGKLIGGVYRRIRTLRSKGMQIFLLSGDSSGNAEQIAKKLGIQFAFTPDGYAKADVAKIHNPNTTAAIGSNRIDMQLFIDVRLRILTLQAGGAYGQLFHHSSIVIPSIGGALDLFLVPGAMEEILRH